MWLALARLVWLGKILARSFKKFGSLSLPQFAARFISLSLPLTGLMASKRYINNVSGIYDTRLFIVCY
jgi:hypothetical protein